MPDKLLLGSDIAQMMYWIRFVKSNNTFDPRFGAVMNLLMKKEWGYTQDEINKIIGLLTPRLTNIKHGANPTDWIMRVYEQFRNDTASQGKLVTQLVAIAYLDGQLSPSENGFIKNMIDLFHISSSDFDRYKAHGELLADSLKQFLAQVPLKK